MTERMSQKLVRRETCHQTTVLTQISTLLRCAAVVVQPASKIIRRQVYGIHWKLNLFRGTRFHRQPLYD